MTNKSESAQDVAPAASRESQHLAALLCPLAWLLRGREGIQVEALLAKVAILVDQGFVPLPGDAGSQTEAAPRSKNEEEWRRTKEIIAGVLERLKREGLCEVIDPGGKKRVRGRRGVNAAWDRVTDGMQKDYDALIRSAKERFDAGEEPDLDALLESSLDGRWGKGARKLMRNDAEEVIDRLRRGRLTSTGAGPGATSPSPEPDEDTRNAVLCCSGSGSYVTEDDGRGGVLWRKSIPAAAGGGLVAAPLAPESAPGTAATATAEVPADPTPGLAECDAGPAHHSIPASDAPGVTTSRSATMEIRTNAALDPTPVPTASDQAPAGPPSLPGAEPPNDQRPPDNAGKAAVAPELPFDPITDLVPPRSGAEYEALKENIRAQRRAVIIWTYQGQIIHDRDSDRACRELGITPKYQEWHDQDSLLEFVLTLNVGDRQLKGSQRAMVAARAIPRFQEKARKRMLAGKAADPPLHEEEGPKGEAAESAAQTMRVSPDSVYKAQRVLKKGVPELQRAVDTRQISVSGAALLAGLDETVQRKIVADGKAAMKEKVKELRNQGKDPEGSASADPGPSEARTAPPAPSDDLTEPPSAGHPAVAALPQKDESPETVPEQQDRRGPTAAPGEGVPKGADDRPLALPGVQHAALDRDVMTGKEPGEGKSKGGEVESANTEAMARGTASQSSEAAVKGLSPGGLQRAADESNRLMEPYDRGCPELHALPGAERDRLTTALGLLEQRARNRREELAEVARAVAEKKDTDPATAE
jgi:hypothetical protein